MCLCFSCCYLNYPKEAQSFYIFLEERFWLVVGIFLGGGGGGGGRQFFFMISALNILKVFYIKTWNFYLQGIVK